MTIFIVLALSITSRLNFNCFLRSRDFETWKPQICQNWQDWFVFVSNYLRLSNYFHFKFIRVLKWPISVFGRLGNPKAPASVRSRKWKQHHQQTFGKLHSPSKNHKATTNIPRPINILRPGAPTCGSTMGVGGGRIWHRNCIPRTKLVCLSVFRSIHYQYNFTLTL